MRVLRRFYELWPSGGKSAKKFNEVYTLIEWRGWRCWTALPCRGTDGLPCFVSVWLCVSPGCLGTTEFHLPLPLMGCCHCHLFLYLTALTRAHLHSYTYEMLERVCKQKTAVVAQSDIECFPAMYMDEAFLGLNPSITINWAWWGP